MGGKISILCLKVIHVLIFNYIQVFYYNYGSCSRNCHMFYNTAAGCGHIASQVRILTHGLPLFFSCYYQTLHYEQVKEEEEAVVVVEVEEQMQADMSSETIKDVQLINDEGETQSEKKMKLYTSSKN